MAEQWLVTVSPVFIAAGFPTVLPVWTKHWEQMAIMQQSTKLREMTRVSAADKKWRQWLPDDGGCWRWWPVVQFRSRRRNTISVVVIVGFDSDDCDPKRRTAQQEKIAWWRRQWQRRWRWTATICQARPPLLVAAAATTTAGEGGHRLARDESQCNNGGKWGQMLTGKGREPVQGRTTMTLL